MKKLMTMIAAVATAFGLYATDTLNTTVDFSEFSDVNPWTLTDKDSQADALWAYTDGATAATPAENEAKIASGKLVLKTGSKVLARKFAATAPAIGNGLYADMKIDLNGEALDEVPDVTGAKLALFALDGTEIEGLPAGTNVYVYAAYGTDGGAALYKLLISADTFLGSARRIAVKSYASVVPGASRAGFLIYTGADSSTTIADVVQVDEVYTFNGTKWEFVQLDNVPGDYLGGLTIDPSYSKWITTSQRSLFVSMSNDPVLGSKLASVDFKGNAAITSITLTDNDPGFPADNATMTIAATDASVTAVEGNGATLSGGVISMPVANVVTAMVTTTKGYLTVKVGQIDATKVAEDKYEFTLVDKGTLTVKGWDAAATVDDVAYETIEEAIEAANTAADSAPVTLKLAGNVETTTTTLGGANKVTFDLNGRKFTLAEGEQISNAGDVEITDSSDAKTGCIIGIVEPGATGTLTITGGSFDKENNSTQDEPPAFYLANNVAGGFTVGEKTIEKVDFWTVVKAAKGTVIFVCEKPALSAEPFVAEVGTTITFPEMAHFVFGDWTNGEGQVVTTVPEGTVQLSPKDIDIDLDKDGSGNYQIADEDDLKTLQAFVAAGFDCSGKTFKQTENIPLTEAWAGIGTQACPFGGIYDGDNNEITGLYFAAANGDYQGFFRYVNGTVENRAVIKNLSISMATDDQAKNIKGGFDLTNAAAKFGGAAFVGHSLDNKVAEQDKCGYVTLENLTAKEGTIESASHNVAGVAVALYNDVIVTGCTNKMTIIGSYPMIGGLICFTQTGTVKLTNCSNEGTVKATNGGGTNGVGGLLAYTASTVSFENCSSTGSIVIENPGVEPVLNASFVGYAANAANNYEDLGGNTTTLTGIPSVNDMPKYLPMNIGDFLFATVVDNTATFVPFDDIVKTDATTYKVMATNKTAIALASGDVLKVDEAMFPLTGVVAETTGDVVTKALVEGTVYTYTCTTPPSGPTADQGTFGEPDASTGYVPFTPAQGQTTVTIDLNGITTTIAIPATIETIIGVPANQIAIMNAAGHEINASAFVGGDDKGFSTALTDAAKKPAFATTTEGETAEKPFVVGDTTVALGVQTISGLTYQMQAEAALDNTWTNVGEAKEGDGQAMTFTVDKTGAPAQFYTIKVTK